MEKQFYYQRKLRETLAARVERNPQYSLRAFSKALGLDPSTFSQLLSGKRFPSLRLAEKLFQRLDFSPLEMKEALQSIAEAKTNAGLKRISPALRHLLSPAAGSSSAPSRDLSIDIFKIISDWYHFAILELIFTQNFNSEPTSIADALGISLAKTNAALERMLELELIEIVNGKIVRRETQLMSADQHLTTAAHRRRQKQVLEKSIESLENDPIEIRNHTAMTFAIDAKKIPEAKKKIAKFTQEMTQFLESGVRDQVYEMTINFFPLQKKLLKKKKVADS